VEQFIDTPEPRDAFEAKNPLATKWLTPPQLAKLVQTQGIFHRKGKFSAEEDQLVHMAIQSYQKVGHFLNRDWVLLLTSSPHRNTTSMPCNCSTSSFRIRKDAMTISG
jgi:hypothetical protein